MAATATIKVDLFSGTIPSMAQIEELATFVHSSERKPHRV